MVLRRQARLVPLVLAVALVGSRCIRSILARVGHPGASLDDAYIHFQYARAIAEGHPFRYQAGEPISTGATSFLWPLVLAPFYAVGFRGEAILWPAWLLSFAALAALAYETYKLALPLTDRGAAIGAGAMVLVFGGLVWGAGSGMEVVPFSWLMARAYRRTADWAEAGERTRRHWVELLVLALLCPLMRPEGALVAIAIAVVTTAVPRNGRWWEAIAFVLCAITPNLLLYALTGKPTSSTAQVKLLFGNPYYAMPGTAIANARLLVGTILNGEVWSAEFLPTGGAAFAMVGLVAVAWRAQRTGHVVRAALVLLFALTMFVPCTYVTFLWNRLRYLWPFAPGWFVGLACFARVIGDAIGLIDRRATKATAMLLAGGIAGVFATRLDWVIEDVAQSASGISRQQVALGHWAHDNLPQNARIGVNDTGAIAYFGDRKTFDIVGLTTPTEGRYWVGGTASRYEHYERLPRSALPTHFIVYPEWFGSDAVLGRPLHEAVVTDSTILGGQIMRASEARWERLGTGDKPWSPLVTILDSVDVADLESEGDHQYGLNGAAEGEQTVYQGNTPDGTIVVDGGRTNRGLDRFTVRLPAGGPITGIARIGGTPGDVVHVKAFGAEIATLELDTPWVERSFSVPAEMIRGDRVEITVAAEQSLFTSFHYWFGR